MRVIDPNQQRRAVNTLSGESPAVRCDTIQRLANGKEESWRRMPVATQGERNHRTTSFNPDFIFVLAANGNCTTSAIGKCTTPKAVLL